MNGEQKRILREVRRLFKVTFRLPLLKTSGNPIPEPRYEKIPQEDRSGTVKLTGSVQYVQQL